MEPLSGRQVQEALDRGEIVEISPGRHRLDGTLVLRRNGCGLRGAGPRASVVELDAPIVVGEPGERVVQDCEISGLGLNAGRTAPLRVEAGFWGHFRDLALHSAEDWALDLAGRVWNSEFSCLRADGHLGGVRLAGSVNNSGFHHCDFRVAAGCDGPAARVRHSADLDAKFGLNNNLFTRCSFRGGSHSTVEIGDGVKAHRFESCNFEYQTRNAVRAATQDPDRPWWLLSFTGCYFQRGRAARRGVEVPDAELDCLVLDGTGSGVRLEMNNFNNGRHRETACAIAVGPGVDAIRIGHNRVASPDRYVRPGSGRIDWMEGLVG